MNCGNQMDVLLESQCPQPGVGGSGAIAIRVRLPWPHYDPAGNRGPRQIPGISCGRYRGEKWLLELEFPRAHGHTERKAGQAFPRIDWDSRAWSRTIPVDASADGRAWPRVERN